MGGIPRRSNVMATTSHLRNKKPSNTFNSWMESSWTKLIGKRLPTGFLALRLKRIPNEESKSSSISTRTGMDIFLSPRSMVGFKKWDPSWKWYTCPSLPCFAPSMRPKVTTKTRKTTLPDKTTSKDRSSVSSCYTCASTSNTSWCSSAWTRVETEGLDLMNSSKQCPVLISGAPRSPTLKRLSRKLMWTEEVQSSSKSLLTFQ